MRFQPHLDLWSLIRKIEASLVSKNKMELLETTRLKRLILPPVNLLLAAGTMLVLKLTKNLISMAISNNQIYKRPQSLQVTTVKKKRSRSGTQLIPARLNRHQS